MRAKREHDGHDLPWLEVIYADEDEVEARLFCESRKLQQFRRPELLCRRLITYAHIRQPDARLRPGMNGNMDVVVSRIPGAISIPAKAVFTRNGKPIAYLADHGRYSPVEIEVLARNPDEVAVKGIHAGAMVTLVEVKKDEKK